MNSNRHEGQYRIFCIPLFLPPSHNKYSPHHPPLKNPQSLFLPWCRTPNFTPTQSDRNNDTLYISTCNILNWKAAGSRCMLLCKLTMCSSFMTESLWTWLKISIVIWIQNIWQGVWNGIIALVLKISYFLWHLNIKPFLESYIWISKEAMGELTVQLHILTLKISAVFSNVPEV